jgi:sigma-B regulation protein RsbU (phosphoserine phosphatase)
VLGLFADAAYTTEEVHLSPGDLVMLFTDGLYEVEDRQNELYSQALLIAGVQRRAQQPAGQLFDELLAEIRHFSADNSFADDVCLVGIEYAGAGAASVDAAPRRHAVAQGQPAREPL